MTLGKFVKPFLVSTVLALGLAGCGTTQGGSDEKKEPTEPKKAENQVVNVYTARHYEADDEVYKNFTEKTGIKVNVVKAEAEELIERLKREGESTQADLFITVDGGVLANAKNNDVLQPVTSDEIDKNVPENFVKKRTTGLEWLQEPVSSFTQRIV